MESLKQEVNRNILELESRNKGIQQQIQESQIETGEKFQRLINENKDQLETMKLKYLNERKEVEIELKDSFFPDIDQSPENVFLNMLGIFKKLNSKVNENLENYQTENCQENSKLRKELKEATDKCEQEIESLTKENLDSMAEKEEQMRYG